MGSETGIILSVLSASRGTISRNNGASPNPIQYNDPTLQTQGIRLLPGEPVSYDISADGTTAMNISVAPVVPVDPDFPADQGTVISTPVNGNLVVAAGTTTTISGTTVSGSITVNGGTLILKSSTQDGTVPAQISGSIICTTNSNLTVYKSSIAGDLSFHDSGTLAIKGGSVGGDTDIHNAQRVKNQGSVGGDTDIKGCMVVDISGLTVNGNGAKSDLRVNNTATTTAITNVIVSNGNALIHNNTGCNYSNITAPQGKVDITGCTGA
jgi:hypothetical protein